MSGKVLTNAIVKEVFTDAMARRGNCKDFDQCLQNGLYEVRIEIPTQNYPSGCYRYGVLAVLRTTNFAVQKYYPHQVKGGVSGNKYTYYVRTWYKDNFSPWREYTQD